MAETPEESDYTAIQQRILEQVPEIAGRKPEAIEKLPEDLQTAIGKLLPFADSAPEDPERVIPYEIRDYLELVDWSGRSVVEGKRGSIPENLPPILERLKIDPAEYIKFINRSEKTRFGNFIGPVEAMRDLAERFGKSFVKEDRRGAAFNPPCSPPFRREGLSGPVHAAFCDQARRKRSHRYDEDARPSETPQTRALTAPQ